MATGRDFLVTAVLITREDEYPKDVVLDFEFDEVIVCTRCPHVFRRYELAAEARNEIIYFQDDDAVINIKDLWTHYDGRRITHAITPGHKKIYEGTGVTLIGWGSFFPKHMVTEFVEEQQTWRDLVGDQVFEAEADRVFTFRHGPHNSVVMPIWQFRRPVRMSDRPDHYRTKDRVIKTLKEWAG